MAEIAECPEAIGNLSRHRTDSEKPAMIPHSRLGGLIYYNWEEIRKVLEKQGSGEHRENQIKVALQTSGWIPMWD